MNSECDEYSDLLTAVVDPVCWTNISANGLGFDIEHSTAGRLIGFDYRMGEGSDIHIDDDENLGLTPQLLAMRFIYNSCNCPLSTFTGE